MIIITVQFDYPGKNDYARLMRAFRNSIKLHEPKAELKELTIPAPVDMETRKRSYASNTAKLAVWVDELKKATDNVLLVDCDMLMTRPISDVWERDFDIAYTYREEGGSSKYRPLYVIENGRKVRKCPKPHPDAPQARGAAGRVSKWPPINGGVMFIRPTERAIAFMERQLQVNNIMMADEAFHNPWRRIYAGINQASFGYMLEKEPICDLLPLTCTEWNSCDGTWTSFDPSFTRMIHVKSGLRRWVLGQAVPGSEHKPLLDLWNYYYNLEV